MRAAAVTVQVKEEIDGLGVTVEDLPGTGLMISEGRFDFDARVEYVFHGLDPPVSSTITLSDLSTAPEPGSLFDIQSSGTLSLELPVKSQDPIHPILIIYASSGNVFDPARLDLSVVDKRTATLTPGKPLVAESPFIIGASETLKGSGQVIGEVINYGLLSPGNSPGIGTFDSLTLDGSSTTEIEIAGTGSPGAADGYDQIQVTNLAQLGGTLKITLFGGFVPSVGQTFDILTFGSVSGAFADATGLFGFGDGSLYFDIVQLTNGIQLQVKQVPGGSNTKIDPATTDDTEDNALGKALGHYFTGFSANVSVALDFAGFVSIAGQIGVERDSNQLKVVAQDARAILGSGSFSAGVNSGELALILKDDGTRIVYASGTFEISGGDFVNASGPLTA